LAEYKSTLKKDKNINIDKIIYTIGSLGEKDNRYQEFDSNLSAALGIRGKSINDVITGIKNIILAGGITLEIGVYDFINNKVFESTFSKDFFENQKRPYKCFRRSDGKCDNVDQIAAIPKRDILVV
jgi:hypothetical protein